MTDREREPGPEGLRAITDLLRPRVSWGQLVGGLLCLVLGFAAVAQIRSNERDTTFATARQDELVGVLSDLGQRSERLRGDLRDLEDTKARLERDARGGTALEEARKRAATYGDRDGVRADGRPLAPPYRFRAIGDPHTMTTALNIPGGLVRTLQGTGAAVSITPRAKVVVDAVRSP